MKEWSEHFSYPVMINEYSEGFLIQIYFSDYLTEEKVEDITYYIESWYESTLNDAYGLGTITWMSDIQYNKEENTLAFEVDMSDALTSILGLLFYILDQSINIKPLTLGKKDGKFVKINKVVIN